MWMSSLLLLTNALLTLWLPTVQGEEMTCEPPDIPNGVYSPHRTTHRMEDEITYECKDGFYPATRGTVAKCTSTGWIPAPRCSLKPCDFPQFKNGRLYHEEYYKPYFPVPIGKEYSYYCNRGFGTPSGSYWDYIRCTVQGWEPAVPCVRKCAFHYVENGESSYWEKTYLQDQSVRVNCYSGYSLPDGRDTITCTENGWSPPPKCIRINNFCMNPPHVENASIVTRPMDKYPPGERIRYECNTPFEIFGEIEVICQNGIWTEPPKCKEMTCEPPDIPNGVYSPHRTTHRMEDEITYECKDGFYPATRGTVAKCTSTGWIPAPRCSLKPCDFPQFKNGRLYHEEYYRPYFPVPIGKEYSYYCNRGFGTPSGSYWDYIRCTIQGWEPAVPCVRKCAFRYVENGESSYWEKTYLQDQSVRVNCYSGYSLPDGRDTITCTENGWSPPPKCIRINNFCVNPPHVENASIVTRPMDKYPPGERIRYECNTPFEIFGEIEVICQNGIWTEPPKCKDSTGKCGPPPPIENGDITSFPLPVYASSSSVEYQCQNLYQMQGEKKITCRNGEWSEPPKCLNACVISEEIMEKHNIVLKWKRQEKHYARSGDVVEFGCKHGFLETPAHQYRKTCIDGHIDYPTCTKRL